MLGLSEDLSRIIDLKGLDPTMFDHSTEGRKRLISLHKEAEKITDCLRGIIEKEAGLVDPSFDLARCYFLETDWNWEFSELMMKKMTAKIVGQETLIFFIEAIENNKNKCSLSVATRELNKVDLPHEVWVAPIKQGIMQSLTMEEFIVGKAIETARDGSHIVSIIEQQKYGWAIAKMIKKTKLSNGHLKAAFEATKPRSLERGAIHDLIMKNRNRENHNLEI